MAGQLQGWSVLVQSDAIRPDQDALDHCDRWASCALQGRLAYGARGDANSKPKAKAQSPALFPFPVRKFRSTQLVQHDLLALK